MNVSTPTAKRKLLMICHGFPPYYGGAELAAGALAREAVRSGHWEVAVLTSDLGGRLKAEEDWEGMKIFRIPAPKKEWTRHSATELGAFYVSARRHAESAINRFKPDYVMAHFSFPAGRLARHLHKRFGIPYSVILQGSDVPGYQPERFRFLYPMLKPVVRNVWQKAAHVVAVSEELKALTSRTLPNKPIDVIPNGVDIEVFSPRITDSRDSDKLAVLVVAQLIERKGIQFLIEALSSLDEEDRKRFHVDIYGSGPYESTLKTLAASAGLAELIRFRGLAAHEELPKVLRAADLFVQPTLQEGLPLALLEAMASGLAIVTTPVGGIPCAVTNGQSGLLVSPADAPALAHALKTLINDPALRAKLQAGAREAALPYGWPSVWGKHDALIHSS